MYTPLPPLPTLQGLFHYNPLTGALTYASDRGPRRAGDPAGSNLRGRLHVFVSGSHYPATEVAMALYRQQDHCPLWVYAINGDYNDLMMSNLALSEHCPLPKGGRPRGSANGVKRGSSKTRDKYLEKVGGKWKASFYKSGAVHYLGVFDSKKMARLARDAATKSELPPYQARVFALGLWPQKTKEPKVEAKISDDYRPSARSRVLLAPAVIRAKTSDLNLRRIRFRTALIGQVFYYNNCWYVKRSSNNAVRADTDERHDRKYFCGTNMIKVFVNPLQPFTDN